MFVDCRECYFINLYLYLHFRQIVGVYLWI